MKQLIEIFCIFFKIGAVTFGGGYAMLPILQHELTVKRDWLKEEEIIDYFAIGQSLPGIIAVNVATFAGSRRRGVLGALAAVLGVILPSVIVICLIASSINTFSSLIWVQKALKGINVVVAVLLTQATYKMAQTAIKGPLTVAIALIAFGAVLFFNVSTVLLLVLAVAVGIITKGGKKA